jgi:hypothetical protein
MTVGRIPSVEGGIQPTIFDAKADLLTATAADTPARLAVGANDLVLTAASGESTGLKYTGGWTNYTPTFTNFTLGNGTITAAKYKQVGKEVTMYVRLTLGSTSTVSAYPFVSLPVNCQTAGLYQGFVTCTDAGTASYLGRIYMNDPAKVWWGVDNSAGTYLVPGVPSATVPFTWGANDLIDIYLSYEVA